MHRHFVVFALTFTSLAGCRHTCSNKRACGTCTTPPVTLGAPPAGAPEILFQQPATAPGATISAPPPAPNFPAEPPRTSGFAPTTANPSQMATTTGPNIRLETPEFSETSQQQTATALKPHLTPVSATVVRSGLMEVTPGQLATGGRPTLDDLDRLAQAGYRRIFVVGGTVSEADARVFTGRGFKVTYLKPSEPIDVVGRSGPAYVMFADRDQSRDWWVRYFREVESLSSDAASIRADRVVNPS